MVHAVQHVPHAKLQNSFILELHLIFFGVFNKFCHAGFISTSTQNIVKSYRDKLKMTICFWDTLLWNILC